MLRCHLCADFFVPSFKLLLFHIAKVHANSPDFHLSCGIDYCAITFTNFQAFRRHLRKKHRSVAIEEETSADDDLSDILEQNHTETGLDCGDEDLEHCGSASGGSGEVMKRDKAVALWILKLKEGHKLTQSTTEEILGDVSELISDMFTRLKKDVFQILASAE